MWFFAILLAVCLVCFYRPDFILPRDTVVCFRACWCKECCKHHWSRSVWQSHNPWSNTAENIKHENLPLRPKVASVTSSFLLYPVPFHCFVLLGLFLFSSFFFLFSSLFFFSALSFNFLFGRPPIQGLLLSHWAFECFLHFPLLNYSGLISWLIED